MLKHLSLAGVLVAALTAGAFAQDAVKDVNECLDKSLELFKSAETANLDADKQTKVEELLGKMESHCDAKQFAEADGVAKEIQSIVGGN